MSRNHSEIRASENQSKFIQDRITQVEKHFGDLCFHVGAYTRKSARLRDKGDDVAKSVMAYAEHESLNHTTKAALTQFAENLSAVQDYRQTQVKRLEARVIEPLTLYGTACKHAKIDLKNAFAARDKEVKQQKTLERVKDRHPSDRHQISQAETELQKASVDASWTSKALEERMDSFEKKKLEDLKKTLMEFVNVEMLFHAKALEMYTLCFQSLGLMSEEEDLEEFRNSLRPSHAQSRLEMQRASSKSSLNSTGRSNMSKPSPPVVRREAAPRTPPHNSRQQPQPQPQARSQERPKQQSMYADDNDLDDDDDDDEYEDEESSDDDDDYNRRYQNASGPRR